MIDEAFDTEFEARLRATLDEMIPKLVASGIAAAEQGSQETVDVFTTRRATPANGSRRLAVAALAVAATIIGLFMIVGRDTDDVVPGDNSPTASAGEPAWYDLIAPSLPEGFPYVALTFATDAQLFFVAIDPSGGKTLDIRLTSGGYQAGPTTTVDATGAWAETAQGWSVGTPAGLFVEVSCDIGVGGRNYAGTNNRCDLTDAVTSPFTKDDIRAVAKVLATSLTVSIFDQNLGSPSGDPIDIAAATALISAAVPGEVFDDSHFGDGADHIYLAGVGVATGSSSDTLPPLDAVATPAGSTVRILHGVYPPVTVTSDPVTNVYDDATVVSMVGSAGVVVRISTTDLGPDALLTQLARDLVALDPTTAQVGPGATIVTALPQTTTSNLVPAGDTTTTIEACDSGTPPPTIVVINASHVVGTAQWWSDNLAALGQPATFASPMNAVAEEPSSRVLALDGYECLSEFVARYTTGAPAEPATPESLQALVAQPLPAGTAIVVMIGDDNLSNATTGATTTSAAF